MSELEYMKRMATICCDTCCVTIESDGKTLTHESNCQLNNLKVLMDLAIKNQRELLQRAETAEQSLATLRERAGALAQAVESVYRYDPQWTALRAAAEQLREVLK